MPLITFREKCPFCKRDAGKRYTLKRKNGTEQHRAYCAHCGYDWKSRQPQSTERTTTEKLGMTNVDEVREFLEMEEMDYPQ